MPCNETDTPQTERDTMNTETPKTVPAPKPGTVREDFGNGIFIDWKTFA